MSTNAYKPNPNEPINLDLSYYLAPKANTKGLKICVFFYAMTAVLCIIALCFRTKVVFIYQYTMLFEAMTGILLFLALKCAFKLGHALGFLNSVTTVPARIIEAIDTPQGTSVTVEYTDITQQTPILYTEQFTKFFVNDLKILGLTALPLSIKGKNNKQELKWLDLKFNNETLITYNLKKLHA